MRARVVVVLLGFAAAPALAQSYAIPGNPSQQGAPDAGTPSGTSGVVIVPSDSNGASNGAEITQGQRPSSESAPSIDGPAGERPAEETAVSAPMQVTQPPKVDEALMLDGHVRSGAFLAGPGSLTFILHHSLLGAIGGLATTGIGSGFRVDQNGTREAMLAGTLIGAGVGFGVSAWWQFNHWLDRPVGNFGIVNSVITGMALTGMVHLFTSDPATLAWTGLIGAELGAWLTVGLGGGEFTNRRGLAIASAGGWAMIYAALFVAIIGTSSTFPTRNQIADTLLIAPGIGALGMALAGLKFDPSSAQVLRADIFGAGVGAAVLLVSALVLGGFSTSTPYVLTLLASAGAITAVTVFWVEAAERQPKDQQHGELYRRMYRSRDKDRKYNNPWW